MGRFDNIQKHISEEKATPFDPVAALADWCAEWMARNGQRSMPAPCPWSAAETGQWFLDHVHRDPMPISDSADKLAASNWFACARSTLAGFLRLTEQQRHWVLGLCKQTRYRGDTWEQYAMICHGHEDLTQDREAYIRGAIGRMKAAAAAMTPSSEPEFRPRTIAEVQASLRADGLNVGGVPMERAA